MKRPRLLVITSTFPVRRGDGMPSFVWDLAERCAERFDVTVLTPMVRGAKRRERAGAIDIVRFRYFPARYEDLAEGAIIENIRARPSRLLQVLPFLVAEALALRALLRNLRPDVLHVHWLVPQGIVARVVAGRVPHVVTTLGGDVYALRGKFASAVKSRVARRAAAVTVMNEDMRTRLIQLGARPESTFIMPMGAETGTVRAAAAGVEREPGRITFAGRMVEKKGAEVLLEAVSELGGEWSLEMIGDGPLRAELQARARRLGPRVTFSGTLSREELARALARGSVFVLPSVQAASGDQDGLPVVLLEAMAAGSAIVASRLPGIAEAIEHERTGLLVSPNDAVALRRAIERVLEDSTLRAGLGEAASGAVEKYSVSSVGRAYVELLESVANARSQGARRAPVE